MTTAYTKSGAYTKPVPVRLTQEQIDACKKAAERRGISVSEFLRRAIDRVLAGELK